MFAPMDEEEEDVPYGDRVRDLLRTLFDGYQHLVKANIDEVEASGNPWAAVLLRAKAPTFMEYLEGDLELTPVGQVNVLLHALGRGGDRQHLQRSLQDAFDAILFQDEEDPVTFRRETIGLEDADAKGSSVGELFNETADDFFTSEALSEALNSALEDAPLAFRLQLLRSGRLKLRSRG